MSLSVRFGRVFVVLLSAAVLSACGGSEDDGDDLEYESVNGYVPMEVPTKDYHYHYLGTESGVDYDAKCESDYGRGFISFLMDEDEGKYVCLEQCSRVGARRSSCETVNNVHYGIIDVTSIWACTKTDGKKVWRADEFLHCQHACNETWTYCD